MTQPMTEIARININNFLNVSLVVLPVIKLQLNISR